MDIMELVWPFEGFLIQPPASWPGTSRDRGGPPRMARRRRSIPNNEKCTAAELKSEQMKIDTKLYSRSHIRSNMNLIEHVKASNLHFASKKNNFHTLTFWKMWVKLVGLFRSELRSGLFQDIFIYGIREESNSE